MEYMEGESGRFSIARTVDAQKLFAVVLLVPIQRRYPWTPIGVHALSLNLFCRVSFTRDTCTGVNLFDEEILRKTTWGTHALIAVDRKEAYSDMQVFVPMQHMRSDSCSRDAMSREEFTIIGREKNPYLLTLKESIFICSEKPKLNGSMTSVPMSLFTA